MPRIRFTYQTITPESAIHGDFADHGYWVDGWKHSMKDDPEAVIKAAAAGEYDVDGTLGYALEQARDLNIREYSNSGEIDGHGWWSSVDPDQNYYTGEEIYYSLHVDGATLSTKKRIDRWLNGKRVIPVKKRSILDVK